MLEIRSQHLAWVGPQVLDRNLPSNCNERSPFFFLKDSIPILSCKKVLESFFTFWPNERRKRREQLP